MTATASRPLTGRHVLLMLVSFFAVVIGVNLVLVYFAKSSWTGLVVQNGYVESQAFNKNAAIARAQEALGWKPEFTVTRGRILVDVTDAAGAPLALESATVMMRRPSSDKLDHELTLASTGTGHFEVAADLQPGIWEADLHLKDSKGNEVRKIYRFVSR
jgi:nitrogen fixation protein FixH